MSNMVYSSGNERVSKYINRNKIALQSRNYLLSLKYHTTTISYSHAECILELESYVLVFLTTTPFCRILNFFYNQPCYDSVMGIQRLK